MIFAVLYCFAIWIEHVPQSGESVKNGFSDLFLNGNMFPDDIRRSKLFVDDAINCGIFLSLFHVSMVVLYERLTDAIISERTLNESNVIDGTERFRQLFMFKH